MKYVKLTPSPYKHDTTANQLRFNVSREDETLFHMGFDMGDRGYLDRDQARQLRDEITAFLGERPCCHDANAALRRDNDDLTRQKDRLLAENIRLSTEKANLNAAITYNQQSAQQLHTENEKLRRRVASLEKDNADLRTARDAQIREVMARGGTILRLQDANNDLREEVDHLKQRVASLEKDADDRRRAFETLFPINPFRWTK